MRSDKPGQSIEAHVLRSQAAAIVPKRTSCNCLVLLCLGSTIAPGESCISFKIGDSSVLGSQFECAQSGLRLIRRGIPAARTLTEQADGHLEVLGTLFALMNS